ncbi:Aste57867_2107 [Aphanomyces stellatus]|uniref:Aste57867_2107 protein n=1 Tax=Aphanomyces stellatus TaxID=120398 RepID=A0A485K7V0_9STRA|nr:hypothetical protein As57867_002102 [Aphanomyces stellatus]VFT79310.1 Aste57867_2107 [Aphanomyces stellatus]
MTSPPPTFFRCPPLTPDERERFTQRGLAAAYEIAEKAQRYGGPIAWGLNSDEKDLQIFKRTSCSPSPPSTRTAFLSWIEVVGTLDEVVELFKSETTQEAKAYCRRFGHLMTDAVTLYSIVPPRRTDQREMINLSWRSFKSAIGNVITPRDACVLDVHHSFTFNGRPVWVRLLKSVQLACCPDLQSTLGFVRMEIEIAGHVFMESIDRPGHLEIGYVVQSDMRGHLGHWASWAIDLSVKKRCRNLLDMDRFLRENRLSKSPCLVPSQLASCRAATQCFLCVKPFRRLSVRRNCVKCGHVFCHHCNQVWLVCLRGVDTKVGVCNVCSLGTTADRTTFLRATCALGGKYSIRLTQNAVLFEGSDGAQSLPDTSTWGDDDNNNGCSSDNSFYESTHRGSSKSLY